MTHRDIPSDRSPSDDELVDLTPLDDAARRAAAGLRAHVDRHLRVDDSFAALPHPGGRRPRPLLRVAALAAALVLLAGLVTTLGDQGDDGGEQVDTDLALPDLEPGLLRPLGPRDGKDSVQLPLTVEPAVGLHDGDQVTVRAEGFVPGESVGLVQCAREAGGETPETRGGVDGCYISDYVNVTADEAGVATGTYAVHRVLTTPLTGTVDCAAEVGRCMVAMGAISDYDRSGGHAIEFATDGEPVELPTASVLPSEGLTDGQTVHVTAGGLTPNEAVTVEVCSSDPVACWMTGERIDVDSEEGRYQSVGLLADGEGHAEGDVPVWRFLPGGEPGTYVDCAVSRCALRVTGSTAPPTVPLHFSGVEPAPVAPSFAVEPSAGLAPGDEVVVAGAGFRPGTRLWISLCATPGPAGMPDDGGGYQSCGGTTDEPITADEKGEFSVTWEVPDAGSFGSSEECTADGVCSYESSQPVTCDDATSHCVVTAEPEYFDGAAALPPIFNAVPVPITFR